MESIPTPYPDLNVVLQNLVESVQLALGQKFMGAYLQGSFAVGDFDEHSDVDFIIVITDDLADSEVSALQLMHARLYGLESAWAQHLEGSYFPQRILRRPPQSNGLLWYLDHGSRSLIQSDHCNTLLVRWVVREQGIPLAGPAPVTLIDPLSVTALRQEMLATIQDWGQDILAHPDHYQNRFYQTYIVLQYCRMLHDLHNGFPGSKRAGAAWAKTTLDTSWKGLIDRTWAGRPNPALSVRQPADQADFQATLEFVRYIINQSRSYATANHLE
ncbi:MAG TPA: aminoglycoside adenylyltransferase domain-containing protein [Ktedonobacterales bacterium]|jgi:hypothetical protein